MASSQSEETNGRPPPFPGVVRVTRRWAAEWQIDNGIILWFQDEEDVVSPHTLAVAAQGVLTALCRDMRKPPSKLVTWIDKQPKSFREQIRNPQNFFKQDTTSNDSKMCRVSCRI